VRQAVLHVLVDRVASARFWPSLWTDTPLQAILQEYVAWLSGCDPAETPILGPIVTEHGEEILPAIFDSLASGSFASEFSSLQVESGSGERSSVPPN
jgi:hypothetical protein